MRWNRDLVICVGTDIPPIGTAEFMLFGLLLELIENKNTNVFTMDEIFIDFTYSKRDRFELLSRLIKRKFITRSLVGNLSYKYEIRPKMTFKDSKEMRIYKPKTRRERINLIKEFTINK